MKIEKERLDAYLTKIRGGVCPLCGEIHWRISDKVFQVMEYEHGGLILGGAAVPVLPLTCMNCGNTYFINALVADLIDKPKKEDNAIAPVKTQEKG